MTNNYEINDIAFDIGGLAIESMMCEVACFPSPGLVSCISAGAHNDMNYFTFIKSTACLSKYMVRFTQEGLTKDTPKEIFGRIRKIGIQAEHEMFKKTEGINTHKGMIFLLGISCAAVAKTIYDKKDFKQIQFIIKEMTKGIVKEELLSLKDNNNHTHGEKLFIKYKAEGIRGEVESGIPIVFDYALQVYEENHALSQNDRLINTLIGIMQYCQDSNVLYRHSMKVLGEVQKKATEILLLGGIKTEKGKHEIEELDKEFIEKNISPGGCADLLAVTVFFDLVKKYMSKI